MVDNIIGPLEHQIGKVIDRKTFYKLMEMLNSGNDKADKVVGATADNLAALTSDGNLKDSGIASEDVLEVGDVIGTSNQVVVTDNGDGTITLSTPQDIDTEADFTLGSLDIDLQSDQLGLEVKGAVSQSQDLQQWKDSDDNVLCRIQPNGRLYTTSGVRADALVGGASLILFPEGGVVIDHSYTGSGNFDLTGGTYERAFTDTTNSPFDMTDETLAKWIIIRSGEYAGAMAEVKTYIDSSTVLLHTMGWDFDLTNVDYFIIEHPAVIIGDGYHNEFQANTTGHFDVHSSDWVGNDEGTNLTEFDLDAGVDTATTLELLTEVNGYADCRALRAISYTGNLTGGTRFANVVSTVDVSGGVGSTSDDKVSGFSSTILGISDIETDAFVARPGHTTAFKVLGTSTVDPDYGYDVTSGVVTDRVTGTPQDGTAFLESSTSDVTLFSSNSDYILIGSDSIFEIINVELTTPSSKGIKSLFEYSTGSGTWSTFTPEDITDNFKQNGAITWDSSTLTGWAKGDEAEAAADITSAYYIKITRQSGGAIPTLPVENYFTISESRAADMLIRGDGIVQLPYIAAAPSNLVNGMMWMESDGLHIYYNDSESVVS